MAEPRRHLHTVDEIVDVMRSNLPRLIEQGWRLKGHYDGNDFVCPSPLRADRKAGSFRICVRGSHKGLVKDFASGESWSALSFTAALMFAGDQGDAIRWAKGFLGLDGTDPDALRQTRVAVEAARDEDPEAGGNDYRALAQRRYLEAREILGTPVERYLLGRAIDLRRLDWPLRSLRYHPQLYNRESGRAWPAMVAPIVGVDGAMLGLHRTWLEVLPGGRVRKAPLQDAKKTLGRYRGGMIRLWAGTRVDPKTGEVKKGRRLSEEQPGACIDLTEGIENALSVAVECPDLRVAATVSVDNMAAVRLPDCLSAVMLWRDNDAPGSPADRRFAAVVEAMAGRGLEVRVARAPDGFKDLNDWLQAHRAGREAMHA